MFMRCDFTEFLFCGKSYEKDCAHPVGVPRWGTVDKSLLSPQTTKNKAGGAAFALSNKEQLAQYAATGFFGSTYYTTASEQLDDVKKLTEGVSDEFLAKCAAYARKQGKLKDMPAYLLAVLAARHTPQWFGRAFPHVIDNGKMLRNFVQIMKSGVTGRKNFGSQPRRLCETWLNSRHPTALLRDSIGEDPSLSYVIRRLRPEPHTPERRALYGYLTGDLVRVCKPRDKALLSHIIARQRQFDLPYTLDDATGTVTVTRYNADLLPDTIKAYEEFKRTRTGAVPDVDFRMLDSLGLSNDEWAEVAARASWTMTIKNLNTFRRHGVFEKPAMVELIAERLSNKELVQKAKTFPYQILSAYLAVTENAPGYYWQFTGPNEDGKMPEPIVQALHDAMEHALENVPYLDANVAICLDVSGSMNSPITGVRKGATTKVRYVDAAALFAAAFMKRSKKSIVLPFDTNCYLAEAQKNMTVMTFAAQLAKLGGGGTQCELPLMQLNARNLKPDVVIFVSDNESWAGHYYSNTTGMMAEWAKLKRRAPHAKLVCIDIAAMTSTQAPSAPDRLNVGGFSDSVFEVVAEFLSGNVKNWVAKIEALAL
jgi:60 kDa SS-A/Ro ribonucleoprotein